MPRTRGTLTEIEGERLDVGSPRSFAGQLGLEQAGVSANALGSIRNKLIFILPVALLLNHFLPALLPIILMVGGTYLAFEGAEKVWYKLSGKHEDGKKGA